jgi:2-polyprenyl-6-methoxyphenol hydroxylase-like FAD-dependent oxidoreductase
MAKILVVGGSLGGLFVGNLLHCAGHEVHILEKVLGSLDGRGAGIVTHPSLMQALSLIQRCIVVLYHK